jgi:nitrate reductase cytochrome c-type subunit
MVKRLISISLIISLSFIFFKCGDGELVEVDYIAQDTVALTNSWEFAIPHQEIPEGLTSLSAESCGTCHQEHYKEWEISTHAHAWTDEQFQSELKKETSPFMCINCHIPLQNQQEYIVTGLINGDIYQPVKEKNPHFDKKLQLEGINCASCHVREGAIVGPTGTDKAPHKTVKGKVHLSEQLCISCHNATAVITPTLACSFETADEWRAGPYAETENCITCHMPELNRAVVAGYEKRKSRRHYFMGSGISKDTNYSPKMLNGYEFYPSQLKMSYKMNDSLLFNFRIKNEHAGHRVPTGDPERFFIFKFKLLDAEGKIVNEKEERIGEHWEWYPKVKKISDNNVDPLEERIFDFNNLLIKKGKYTLSVEVTKHRMNIETAKYNKLSKAYPLFISVYEKSIEFTVQ